MVRSTWLLVVLSLCLAVPAVASADVRGRAAARATRTTPARSAAARAPRRDARPNWTSVPIADRVRGPRLLLHGRAETANRREKLEVVRNNLDAVIASFQYNVTTRSVSDALYKLGYVGDVISRGEVRIRKVSYGDRRALRTALEVVQYALASNGRSRDLYSWGNPDGPRNRIASQGAYHSPYFDRRDAQLFVEAADLREIERVLQGMVDHRAARVLTEFARSR